jgi:zinc transport system permease protein
MEVITLAFMQRALVAAILTGLVAPAIGTYVVQRRLSLLGDGLGHVAIAGVGLALLTNTSPLPVAVVVCVAGAVGIELLRERGRARGDVALAVLFYGGLASGVLMAGAAGQGAGTLSNYLFGSLTSVTTSDLAIVGILGVAVLLAAIGLAPQLFAVCADEDFARVLGLRVRAYNLLIVVLAAVTVTTAMRTVGLLLVSALMVIPVATSQNVFKGFRAGLYGAMAIGVAVAISGVFGSFYADVPPGAFIVVLAIGAFALSWPVTSWRHRLRPLASVDEVEPLPHEPTPAHEHVHGPGCGHRVVEHGDHVDYVHEGHRHVAHADHYDEH